MVRLGYRCCATSAKSRDISKTAYLLPCQYGLFGSFMILSMRPCALLASRKYSEIDESEG